MASEPLKEIIFVYAEDCGEVEGAFTPEGELIDTWCCNDATWRGEYFAGLLEHMGYTEVDGTEEFRDACRKKLEDFWNELNPTDDEDDEEE